MTKIANLALLAILRVSTLGHSFDLQACSHDDCSVGGDAHSVLQTRASVRADRLLVDSTHKRSSSLANPLLQQVETMAELASADRNMTLMKVIMQMLNETLLPGLENSTKQAQKELDVANQRIVKCNSDTQIGQTKVDTIYKEAADAAETTHSQCRVRELQLADLKNQKCAARDQFQANLNYPCPAPDGSASTAEHIAHMVKAQKWYTSNLEILKDFHKECNDATAALDASHETCDDNQGTFESHFCEYRTKLLDLEKNSTACYETSKTAYESMMAAKKQMLKDTWVVEYLAMKKIECFLQVWLSDNNVSTVDKGVPAKCSQITVENLDMTPITLKYEDIPPAQIVSIEPVLEYPGSSGFVQKYYTQGRVTYNDVDACVVTTTTEACVSADDAGVQWHKIWSYHGGSGGITVFRPSKPGYCSLGDIIVKQKTSTIPAGTKASFLANGVGAAPKGFEWKVAENQAGGINYFEPVCPEGFIALGHVGVQSPESSKTNYPPNDSVCCAPSTMGTLTTGTNGYTDKLWSDPGTGGMDNGQFKRLGLETFVADPCFRCSNKNNPSLPYYALASDNTCQA